MNYEFYQSHLLCFSHIYCYFCFLLLESLLKQTINKVLSPFLGRQGRFFLGPGVWCFFTTILNTFVGNFQKLNYFWYVGMRLCNPRLLLTKRKKKKKKTLFDYQLAYHVWIGNIQITWRNMSNKKEKRYDLDRWRSMQWYRHLLFWRIFLENPVPILWNKLKHTFSANYSTNWSFVNY